MMPIDARIIAVLYPLWDEQARAGRKPSSTASNGTANRGHSDLLKAPAFPCRSRFRAFGSDGLQTTTPERTRKAGGVEERCVDNHKASTADGPLSAGEPEVELLYLVETDCGPKTDRASLLSRLKQSQGFLAGLADRTEVQLSHHPLASLNAYKHRLQAIRCEYVSARLRAEDLEGQVKLLEGRLAEAQAALRSLEERLAEAGRETGFYRYALDRMEESRAWQLLQYWRRFRLRAAGLVARISGLGAQESSRLRGSGVR
jgi:hypothetical protein